MSYYENIDIRVIPSSSKNMVEGKIGDRIKIRVKSSAKEGAANEELIRFLSKILKKPQSYIDIIYGEKSKDKTIRILCFDNNDLNALGIHK